MKSFENKIEQTQFEENPFEDDVVSQEWINSVENEKDMVRDLQIYPRLNSWIQEVKPDIVVEIGSGQGICSDKILNFQGQYIGIEPAKKLVDRALELYKNNKRDFIIGNAYKLPLANESCDASFAINVWFHLENLQKASAELSRILKKDGRFLIITVNPEDYESWIKAYEDPKIEGKKIVGKVNTPINPLSKNTFYRHSMKEIENSLKQNGLDIDEVNAFGWDDRKVFLAFKGHKK